jgi:putative transposase
MKKPRFTDSQIAAILTQAEARTPVADLCREYGVSSASFYQWRSKYGGIEASLMRRLREKEAENARLKKMYADERIKPGPRQEAV